MEYVGVMVPVKANVGLGVSVLVSAGIFAGIVADANGCISASTVNAAAVGTSLGGWCLLGRWQITCRQFENKNEHYM